MFCSEFPIAHVCSVFEFGPRTKSNHALHYCITAESCVQHRRYAKCTSFNISLSVLDTSCYLTHLEDGLQSYLTKLDVIKIEFFEIDKQKYSLCCIMYFVLLNEGSEK